MKNQMLKKGFTLIELIVVMIVIAILSFGAFSAFGGESQNAEFAKDINKLGSQESVLSAKMLRDFTVTNTAKDKALNYRTVESTFEVTAGTAEQATISEVLADSWSDMEFDKVVTCGNQATVAQVNTALGILATTDANAVEVNGLVVFTDDATSDCTTTTAVATDDKIVGISPVFYNPILATGSDDYLSSAMGDGNIGETDTPVVSRYIELIDSVDPVAKKL